MRAGDGSLWWCKLLGTLIQRNRVYRDAIAIMEASFWSGVSFVTPKTVEQQDIQSLLRTRKGYLDNRTAISNQIRG